MDVDDYFERANSIGIARTRKALLLADRLRRAGADRQALDGDESAWEKAERAAQVAPSSPATRTIVLALLADATPDEEERLP